jgi:TPP-dependent pyruvate/acetoin dehydrogenase alpha subunit
MARAKPTPPAPEQHLPREQLVEFLAEMLLIRRFEEKVEERFRAGGSTGFPPICLGP